MHHSDSEYHESESEDNKDNSKIIEEDNGIISYAPFYSKDFVKKEKERIIDKKRHSDKPLV